MENGSRADAAFRRYSDLLGFGKYQEDGDDRSYDMSQRLKLAELVVKDGKRVVADLGSHWGGMSHALKEAGVKRVVSTEHILSYCTKYIRKVNKDDLVLCDSFHLPLRRLDALVSYMFLGQNLGQNRMPYVLGDPQGLKEIFERLSGSADTIYSVERQSEYSRWFDPKWFDPKERTVFASEEIGKKLRAALSPDFEVESLGGFGLYRECPADAEARLGFKFTKKREITGAVRDNVKKERS